MKLRNKKTGEIAELLEKPNFTKRNDNFLQCEVNTFNSLAELNAEWEDYEEPKEWWFIDYDGEVVETTYITDYDKTNLRKFGNYFETKEDAEKVAEKLKAWKRLKDKGFNRVFSLELGNALCGGKTVAFKLLIDDKDSIEDIKLLFGDEE